MGTPGNRSCKMVDQEPDITGLSGMVTARQTVMFTTATTKVHEHPKPAPIFNGRQQRLDVMGVHASFKSVKNRDDRAACIRGQTQVDEVPIG